MKTPVNTFKHALQHQQAQIGLWLGLAEPCCAEILAGTGYDGLPVDGEHASNDVRSVLAQLRAVASATRALAGAGSHPVVRVPVGDAALIKQYLDLGAQTILVPMVDTAEQAQTVEAVRPSGRDCRHARRRHYWNSSSLRVWPVQRPADIDKAIKIIANFVYFTRARGQYD